MTPSELYNKAVFNKKACHIIRDSPHNKGLVIEGWLSEIWYTDLPHSDCFLVINGEPVCLAANCLLSMKDLWIREFNVETPLELYEKAGQILKFF